MEDVVLLFLESILLLFGNPEAFIGGLLKLPYIDVAVVYVLDALWISFLQQVVEDHGDVDVLFFADVERGFYEGSWQVFESVVEDLGLLLDVHLCQRSLFRVFGGLSDVLHVLDGEVYLVGVVLHSCFGILLVICGNFLEVRLSLYGLRQLVGHAVGELEAVDCRIISDAIMRCIISNLPGVILLAILLSKVIGMFSAIVGLLPIIILSLSMIIFIGFSLEI